MRDQSKLINPPWTAAMLARIGKVPEKGACACGRTIVYMGQTWRCGQHEFHSRRRCLFSKTRKLVVGARW